MGQNIGFISTRFAGTDGVTLEANKWAEVLEKAGHQCFWFAGELDKEPEKSFHVSEGHFLDEQNRKINDSVFGKKLRKASVTEKIHALRSLLKVNLYEFIEQFKIDLIIPENVLTIPLHIPLGIALTEVIAETQIPTIAHHHDFHWERVRFSVNAVEDYLHMAFPPCLPNIEHVVINSAAQEELAHRTGISSTVIPNVFDFETPPIVDFEKSREFLESFGLNPEDVIILQPTRIVQRKGIEHAISLVKELGDPRYKLVISHEAGDEGFEYAEWLTDYARGLGVELYLVATQVGDPWKKSGLNEKLYTLWDVYPYADFITYPSLYEGFGNAFLEAIYFKKPILINRYSIFVRDIEPKGFDLVVMDGFLTKKEVKKVREILENQESRQKMVDHNYEIAKRHYSYEFLRRRLDFLLTNFFGTAL
ncbi:MAG: glycosyltransferase family 4 protein [Deltaproteobacteria bacterium]|jgi:glycosyltransferase involved in cell wall biosynthesis|nr:glycosyltransferase family 4 protein [Deltaproteobacteria bacterium]PNV84959.1 MAG: glycosyl transferase family 1 [Desulfobacteraceae bacterium]MDH3773406.1 glycosyltransferase family 4 protein [Deltaproteobacteria bacterium]MDH3803225.1 glycosyltransferase family 4 protein [Deltaproteobacteria bacterium]MDH3849808.1 glycosyltransferase family 4 protein [Deltaproteobacteria bacterium]